MNPLNDNSVVKLHKMLNEIHDTPLQASGVESKMQASRAESGRIVVTNGAWLLEWPAPLVTTNCKTYQAMLNPGRQRASIQNWRRICFGNCSPKDFIELDEVDPTTAELENLMYACLVFAFGKKRIYYNAVFMEATDMFIKDPIFKMLDPDRKTQKKALGVFNGDYLVGAWMNTIR